MNGIIKFYNQEIKFNLLRKKEIKAFIREVFRREKQVLKHLTFIFCNDRFLHQLNLHYLKHDTYTDVLTFNLAAIDKIQAEVYISIDRIRHNASLFDVPFKKELLRVVIHSVLHLCGHSDLNPENKVKMTRLEDFYLSLMEDYKVEVSRET